MLRLCTHYCYHRRPNSPPQLPPARPSEIMSLPFTSATCHWAARNYSTTARATHHRGVLWLLLGFHEPVEDVAAVVLVDVDVAREHVESVLHRQVLRAGEARPVHLVRQRFRRVVCSPAKGGDSEAIASEKEREAFTKYQLSTSKQVRMYDRFVVGPNTGIPCGEVCLFFLRLVGGPKRSACSLVCTRACGGCEDGRYLLLDLQVVCCCMLLLGVLSDLRHANAEHHVDKSIPRTPRTTYGMMSASPCHTIHVRGTLVYSGCAGCGATPGGFVFCFVFRDSSSF